MPTAIWWIRRDLRLEDNPTLAAALAGGRSVVPVFILDVVPQALATDATVSDMPVDDGKPLAFLLGGLRHLDACLKVRGSYLVIRAGEPEAALTRLMQDSGATMIYAERDHSPGALARDAQLAAVLPLDLVDGLCIHSPGSILKTDGSPYVIFTPFSRAWRALPLPTKSDLIPLPTAIPTPTGVYSLPIPASPILPPEVPFDEGETAAHKRLDVFTLGMYRRSDAYSHGRGFPPPPMTGTVWRTDEVPICRYHAQRDLPAVEGTSGLSPYLRFGMISARTAAVRALEVAEMEDWYIRRRKDSVEAQQAFRQAWAESREARAAARRKGAETWLTELIWRDFFIHILRHFPQVANASFRPELRDIAWANDPADFEAWCAGQTGYPIVDAGMRQLLATGWMHNRVRMIVASFLVKDLLVDWRWGERHFMRHLIDGDPAVNNGNWQWAAGTGTDAAPYFRIFNPTAQGERFDPAGAYVRRWVPELAGVPDRLIHRPWDMPPDLQCAAGCILGRDYPLPIVDHAWARERVLAAYRRGQV